MISTATIGMTSSTSICRKRRSQYLFTNSDLHKRVFKMRKFVPVHRVGPHRCFCAFSVFIELLKQVGKYQKR